MPTVQEILVSNGCRVSNVRITIPPASGKASEGTTTYPMGDAKSVANFLSKRPLHHPARQQTRIFRTSSLTSRPPLRELRGASGRTHPIA